MFLFMSHCKTSTTIKFQFIWALKNRTKKPHSIVNIIKNFITNSNMIIIGTIEVTLHSEIEFCSFKDIQTIPTSVNVMKFYSCWNGIAPLKSIFTMRLLLFVRAYIEILLRCKAWKIQVWKFSWLWIEIVKF